MRTQTWHSMTITYPEEVVFAFNPNYITIVTPSSYVGGSIELELWAEDDTDTVYTDERDVVTYGDYGRVQFNISAYLQTFFSGADTLDTFTTCREIVVRFQDSSEYLGMSFSAIFGAMQPTETFNPSRTGKWWTNYPQTATFYSENGGDLFIRQDATEYNTNADDQISDTGMVTLTLADIFDTASEYGAFEYVDSGGTTIEQYFELCDCEGIFLRWLDRHGMFQYWLFEKGVEAVKDTTYGEVIPVLLEDDTQNYWMARYQGKNMGKTITACAPLIDKDGFDFLTHLASSPHVSVYEDEQWLPVTIAAATHSWAKEKSKPLQDFEITIIYSDITSPTF